MAELFSPPYGVYWITLRLHCRAKGLLNVATVCAQDPVEVIGPNSDGFTSGTWLDSDNGLRNGKLPVESNVTRLSRAIKPKSLDQVPQVVYYQGGVGSDGGIIDRILGGATAQGISDNIREGYEFIATNYARGDEIYLVGFSRGAFTARSIAAMIGG
ncbi:MAG: hypothetical protein Q9187_007927, partial [Circinaria calcarea]